MSPYFMINTQFFVAGLLAGMAPGAYIMWRIVRKAINRKLKETIKEMIDDSVVYYFKEHDHGSK